MFGDEQFRKTNLSYDGTLRLFTKNSYIINAQKRNDTDNSFETYIENKIKMAKGDVFNNNNVSDILAQKFAKNMNSIFIKQDEFNNLSDEEKKQERLKISADKYKLYTGKDLTKNSTEEMKKYFIIDGGSPISGTNLYKYGCYIWEYMQFKKCKFKCMQDSIEIDDKSGRIKSMNFKCTGIK